MCVSDRQEYAELASERGATSAWYFKPDDSIDAASTEAFELLEFTVNGEEGPIRRAVRKRGQQYSVTVGNEHKDGQELVTISYTYRTVTAASGHLLFFDIEQPTRDLTFDFDYTHTDISSIAGLDLIPSVRPIRIEHTPEELPTNVRVELTGWTFPRSGIAVRLDP